jgi:hypothetical protein
MVAKPPNLAEMKCKPCHKGSPSLGATEIQEYMQRVSEWELIDGTRTSKTCKAIVRPCSS